MSYVRIMASASETRQENQNGRVESKIQVFTENPIQGDDPTVVSPHALPFESDVGDGSVECGEDGLNVSVPSDDWIRSVLRLKRDELGYERRVVTDELQR